MDWAYYLQRNQGPRGKMSKTQCIVNMDDGLVFWNPGVSFAKWVNQGVQDDLHRPIQFERARLDEQDYESVRSIDHRI